MPFQPIITSVKDVEHKLWDLLSISRIASLLGSVLVALCSGSNYIYSVYAPQLAARLHLTNTQLNIVGIAANAGTYIAGPVLGRIVDAYGPRIPLIKAFIFCLVGYGGMKLMFDNGVGVGETLSLQQFSVLVFFSMLTGFGASGGQLSAVNTTAKNFPKSMATTTGLVVSGFGLSALFFSTIARAFFPGDPSALLLLLALTTSMPVLLALFIVQPIPLPSIYPPQKMDQDENHDSISNETALPSTYTTGTITKALGMIETAECQPLLKVPTLDTNAIDAITKAKGMIEADEREPRPGVLISDSNAVDTITKAVNMIEAGSRQLGVSMPSVGDTAAIGTVTNMVSVIQTDNRQPLLGDHRMVNYRGVSESSSLAKTGQAGLNQSCSQTDWSPEIYGIKLLLSPDFYILIAIVSLLAGTGLMYINNVGLITLALYAKGKPIYNEIELSAWQTAQVSILSISNWAGRILIGLVSDFMQTHLHLPRAYSLCIVSSLFIMSQMAVISVSSITTLWVATVMVGIAYGSLLGALPSITIDWFGLGHHAENSGWVMLSPLPSANFFAIMFGRNLDMHTPSQGSNTFVHIRHVIPAFSDLVSGGNQLERQCLVGRECYVSSLRVTLTVSTVSLMLSVLAVIRDTWRNRRRARSIA